MSTFLLCRGEHSCRAAWAGQGVQGKPGMKLAYISADVPGPQLLTANGNFWHHYTKACFLLVKLLLYHGMSLLLIAQPFKQRLHSMVQLLWTKACRRAVSLKP